MTSYALPVPPMPQSHEEHWHGHMHSHSHSPPSLSSRRHSRASKSDRPNGTAQTHIHSHSHGQNNSSYRANSNHPLQRPPLPTLYSQQATTVVTAEEKPPIAPAKSGSEKTYEAPAQSTTQLHDHGSAERSSFTNFLLPYTAGNPLLHTVMTEKDSRRILYFMR